MILGILTATNSGAPYLAFLRDVGNLKGSIETSKSWRETGTSPEGTAESSPARSAGDTSPARQVPKGRLKITQDAVLGKPEVRTGDILDILDRALG